MASRRTSPAGSSTPTAIAEPDARRGGNGFRQVDVLIVGAGPAGAECALALREGGFQGSILLAGRDADPPYDRPAVSKGLLRGTMAREEALLHPPEAWVQRDIELLTRVSVMKLDPQARVARLSDRSEVAFGSALLATGANVRRLRVEGGQLDGIHFLRAPANAHALRADAEGARRAVIAGGSFIACETAAALTGLGVACTLVMPEEAPLADSFGTAVGGHFARLLERHGVELVCGDGLERLEAADAPAGDGERPRVGKVVTASGRELEADLVVMGTGAVPDVMLARSAGLELGESGGIRCSATLETSAPGIWAAGDVCEYDSVLHGRRLRIEHWEVARAQGRAVAAAMMGEARPFDEVPWFWSDIGDWARLEYVGPADEWDAEVVRGSFDDGAFLVFYLAGGRVKGALSVGRDDDLVHAARMLHRGTDVSGALEALADPAVPLSRL